MSRLSVQYEKGREASMYRSRSILFGMLFAIPLSACLVLGAQLERSDHLTPDLPGAALFVILAVILSIITTLSLRWQPAATTGADPDGTGAEPDGAAKEPPASETAADRNGGGRREYLKLWAAIALPNLIVLLGVYPGFFVYDAQDELMEVVTRTFTTHHPLSHVLALGGVISAIHKVTGSWNAGIFGYLLLQMLFITATEAAILKILRRAGLPRFLMIASAVWYAVFPTVVMYHLSSTKDGLFAAFMTLYVTGVLMILYSRKGWDRTDMPAGPSDATRGSDTLPLWGLTAVSGVCAMLLRNNACYAMLVFAGFLLLCALVSGPRRRRYRKLAAIIIISIVIYYALNFLLIRVTHASDEEHQESITVAIQTLGRAWQYHPEQFDEADREILFRYLTEDGLSRYELRNSDYLKSTFQNAYYEENAADFWRLWIRIGRRCPATYLNGWLLTSYGLWYPFAVNNVYEGHAVFTFTYEDSSYFGYETEEPGIRHSLIPPIDAFYRFLSLDPAIQRIPVLSLLFAPAFYFWLYLYFVIRRLCQKRGSEVIPFVPLFLLWATHLIGPSYLVRYALWFFTTLPVLGYMVSGSCFAVPSEK